MRHPSSEQEARAALAAPAPVTEALLRGWPLPEPGMGKDDRGAVLVVGGAAGTPGAVLLAGLAALRAGAGRLQLAVAEGVAPEVAVAVPEALVVALPGDDGRVGVAAADVLEERLSRASAVCVGPGLDADGSAQLVPALLTRVGERTAVVVDALGLTGLCEHPEVADHVAGRLVLTPNPREAAMLLDLPEESVLADLEGAAVAAAAKYRAVVTVHGRTADPDGVVWVDASGGPGLGTSGSGDVLAGAVTGLLARGASASQAAVWGTHLHAAAGDRLATSIGPLGYLARELLDELPRVLAHLSV